MSKHFILVANSVERYDGGILPGDTIARRRLSAGLWPLYARTPHRKELSLDDRVIIYLAGKGIYSQHFIAKAIVKASSTIQQYDSDGHDVIITPPESVLMLDNILIFTMPITIRPLIMHLSFMPHDKSNWGFVLQRGCKKINEADYNIIVNATHS